MLARSPIYMIEMYSLAIVMMFAGVLTASSSGMEKRKKAREIMTPTASEATTPMA